MNCRPSGRRANWPVRGACPVRRDAGIVGGLPGVSLFAVCPKHIWSRDSGDISRGSARTGAEPMAEAEEGLSRTVRRRRGDALEDIRPAKHLAALGTISQRGGSGETVARGLQRLLHGGGIFPRTIRLAEGLSLGARTDRRAWRHEQCCSDRLGVMNGTDPILKERLFGARQFRRQTHGDGRQGVVLLPRRHATFYMRIAYSPAAVFLILNS